MLFQKVLEEGVAYWSFMFEGTKSCDLLLRMRVEKRDDEEGLLIRVESVDEEGERGDEGMEKGMESRLTCVTFAELEATSLPNPHSTASKKLRILLKEGTIFLQPLEFGQVRGCEERSDVLRKCVYGISALYANAPIFNVAAAKFDTISNARIPTYTPSSLRLALLVADLFHIHSPGGRRRGHEGRRCCVISERFGQHCHHWQKK